jgi:hypothetical protein
MKFFEDKDINESLQEAGKDVKVGMDVQPF